LKRHLWAKNLIGWLIRVYYRISWKNIDSIPDDERLWRSVYNSSQVKPDGSIKPGFFKNKDGLSTDLSKFSTVEKSRRGRAKPPWPASAGLVEFKVMDLKEVSAGQTNVAHDPIRTTQVKNYSHTISLPGLSTAQAKEMLGRYKFLVKPSIPQDIKG